MFPLLFAAESKYRQRIRVNGGNHVIRFHVAYGMDKEMEQRIQMAMSGVIFWSTDTSAGKFIY